MKKAVILCIIEMLEENEARLCENGENTYMIKKLFCMLLCLSVTFCLFACDVRDGKILSDEDIRTALSGKDGKTTVLLDAGHGFGDPGCTSEYLNGQNERDITLSYIYQLKEKLEAKGFEVLLTHDGTVYMSETELTEKADLYDVEYNKENIKDNGVFDAYERAVYVNVLINEREVDYFLSVHVNASATSSTAEGFEIDYCAENGSSRHSEFVFRSICESLEEGFPDTPRKEFADSWADAFIVTKYTNIPSALLELGFATTPSDAEKILDTSWQSELCDAVANGISKAFGK